MYGVSIDPGVNDLSYAIWNLKTKQLLGAAMIQAPQRDLAHALWANVDNHIGGLQVRELHIEKPQVYQTKHQKGDQKDIINLAMTVGMVAGKFYEENGVVATYWLPSEWKGQAPKTVTKLRVEETLSVVEKNRITWPSIALRHNVSDAIHLGLVKVVGRCRKVG